MLNDDRLADPEPVLAMVTVMTVPLRHAVPDARLLLQVIVIIGVVIVEPLVNRVAVPDCRDILPVEASTRKLEVPLPATNLPAVGKRVSLIMTASVVEAALAGSAAARQPNNNKTLGAFLQSSDFEEYFRMLRLSNET